MGNRIITISREFGSGGRTIGNMTAEKLGIKCYDAELIQKIAAESGLAADYVEEKSEHASRLESFKSPVTAGMAADSFAMDNLLWQAQSKVIKELADKESCVIVGRCADYILREYDNILTVFIHADFDKRVERVVQVYGESSVSPQKRVKEKDKRRKTYYRFNTDMEWGQAEHYHICLDSGVLGIDKCVQLLCELY